MKFTLIITALSFFATSAVATREWSYNDHRRSVFEASLEQGRSCLTPPAKAKHADLCKRWDGPRCLDDEDKPSPWEMNYLERKTAKTERQEAGDAIEKIHALWNKWNAEQADMLSKVKKGGKTYVALLEEIDQNSEAFQPEYSTSAMCQRILSLLNELVIMFPDTTHPSPDTIPLVLCLLFRYRVALASTFPREAIAKYDVLCASERVSAPVPCYVSTPVSATQLDDATLIALSHIAYKFLADDRKWLNLQHWVRLLEANQQSILEAEKTFLKTIDYAVCV
ncbi:hypothetical protein CC77DRAFT_1085524 [Alternaria alternata]|uniref:Uncharacterized protein n=1 Tax=Alternaria alternata TaxID=5599 RepID=A0A177D0S8_ALTAL|nr:hypothetical protein CC77DRAFT_1085524 [Alternaria alternata]OAG13294.1 hypothetical protein CC77DRAFT_1085524 [Alternaria alternata]